MPDVIPDLAVQLRAVVEASAEPLQPADVMVRRTSTRRWRGARAAVAVAAAVVIIGAGVGALVARTRPHHPTTVVTGGGAAPGWHALSPGPLAPRQGALMAWTGSRLVVWGGDLRTDGATYDPTTDSWVRMAPSPLTAGTDHVGVWDGRELLAWDEGPGGGRGAGAGAAYDPATDRWRPLAASPLPAGTDQPVLVWDGHEVLAWAASRPDGSAGPVRTVMAAFDPSANRWQRVPAGPLDVNNAEGVWTGHVLVMVGWMSNAPNGVFPGGGVHPAAAYDPGSESWRAIAAPPWDPTEDGSALAMAWTGSVAVVYTYGLRAATYDPSTGRWSALPDVPLAAHECAPGIAAAAGTVLATYCGQAAVLYPAARVWATADATPPGAPASGDSVASSTAIAADGSYLLWAPVSGPRGGVWQRAVAFAFVPATAPPVPPSAARLALPRAMAATPAGDVLIADDGTNELLRLRPDGTLTVVAGTGTAGYTGDGGPAPDAELRQPGGIAVAPDGTVYVADTANNRVRRIGTDGMITTVAGNGRKGGGTGPASEVPIGQPLAVAYRNSSLYVVDDAGVQLVAGGRVTTLVGAGPSKFTVDGSLSAFFPSAIAVDPAGDLFVGEYSSKYLIELSPAGRPLRTWPVYVSGAGIAIAPGGDVIVADYNYRIDRVAAGQLTTVVTFGLGSVAGLAGTFRPSGVAVTGAGVVYAADDGVSGGAGPALIRVTDGRVGLLATPP